MSDDLHSFFDIPEAKGPEILDLLCDIDPLSGCEEGKKFYMRRTEEFCRDFTLYRLTNTVTPPFIGALVERMFTAEEVTSGIDQGKLVYLKFKIVALLLHDFTFYKF